MKKIKIYRTRSFLSRFPICMLLTAACIWSSQVSGQSVAEVAKAYMDKQMDYYIDAELVEQLSSMPVQRVIEEFDFYTSDSLSRVRQVAYQMIYKMGIQAEDQSSREQAVKALVKGLNDTEAGVVGKVADYLTGFTPTDFNAEQKYLISQKVKASPPTPYIHKLILLTGYLGIEELIYDYQKMLNDTTSYSDRIKWNMQLAMARMNDAQSVNYVTRRISSLPVNDNVIYDIYPSLAYIRQKVAFDMLLNVVLSDEKNCLSSNPDNEAPIICAFRVMGYIAPYIKDFPLETDQWGDPVFNDYDAALAEVRGWINANRDDYALVYDKY